MKTPKSAKRVVAVALWLAAAPATLLSAQFTTAPPMMDYGVGQFATIEQWSGSARTAADDSYVMDYGVGRYATVAAWMGVDAARKVASRSPERLVAKR